MLKSAKRCKTLNFKFKHDGRKVWICRPRENRGEQTRIFIAGVDYGWTHWFKFIKKKKKKNYFHELRNILKLNSYSNKFHGSLYEKQLVQDFIQRTPTCFVIQSIFPFVSRFPQFVVLFCHMCFPNICSNSPSFVNPKFYFLNTS